MREIIFRGKRIDNGEWVHGLPYSFKRRGWDVPHYTPMYILMWNPDWDLEAQFNYLKDPKGFSHLADSIWKVIPESVGQYVGVKNKRKIAIFDEDIIKVRGYKHNRQEGLHFCFIQWWDGMAQWGLREYKLILDDGRVFEPKETERTGFRFEDVKMETIEIIGNLTDNPELIESDTKKE